MEELLSKCFFNWERKFIKDLWNSRNHVLLQETIDLSVYAADGMSREDMWKANTAQTILQIKLKEHGWI